jgi:hypothetical protein
MNLNQMVDEQYGGTIKVVTVTVAVTAVCDNETKSTHALAHTNKIKKEETIKKIGRQQCHTV